MLVELLFLSSVKVSELYQSVGHKNRNSANPLDVNLGLSLVKDDFPFFPVLIIVFGKHIIYYV